MTGAGEGNRTPDLRFTKPFPPRSPRLEPIIFNRIKNASFGPYRPTRARTCTRKCTPKTNGLSITVPPRFGGFVPARSIVLAVRISKRCMDQLEGANSLNLQHGWQWKGPSRHAGTLKSCRQASRRPLGRHQQSSQTAEHSPSPSGSSTWFSRPWERRKSTEKFLPPRP